MYKKPIPATTITGPKRTNGHIACGNLDIPPDMKKIMKINPSTIRPTPTFAFKKLSHGSSLLISGESDSKHNWIV
jgi:hypothetical protein